MYFFASMHVWACTFIFFAAIAFLFDSKLMLGNILGYAAVLFIAHIARPDEFLPIGEENAREVIAYRIVIYVLTSFCIMIIVYFVERFLMQAWESDEENAALLEKQLKYYKDLELLDREVRKFRHDVKNHFICMENLLNTGKTEELREYFEELLGSFMTQKKMFLSGNEVVDAIMHYELYHSCNSDVNISVHGGLPNIKTVSSIDMCTLFSNLLSNAIASVNKCTDIEGSWLEVAFSAGNTYFSITVTNNIVKEEIRKKTTKRDRNHGHGISKIKGVIQKYDGRYELKVDEHKLSVSVYLPI